MTATTKRGRPTKYDPLTIPARAGAWAREGLPLKHIARRLGVGRTTLARWKAAYPELDVALQAGWEEASELLIESLFHYATGADYTDFRVRRGPRGVTVTQIHRSRQPAYRAASLWLSKHRPEQWGPQPQPSAREM